MAKKAAKWETINPDRAKRDLKKAAGRNFRGINRGTVDAISVDLRNGDYEDNGETIKYDADGYLIDGQNRFTAVVETGISIKTLVAYDIENHYAVDRGLSRTFAQELKFRGVSASTHKASIVTACVRSRPRRPYAQERSNRRMSAHVQIKFWERHSKTVEEVYEVGRSMPLSFQYTAPIIYRSNGIHDEDALEFWEILRTGVSENKPMHPALALRNRILEDKLENRHKLSVIAKKYCMLACWNCFMAGDVMDKVRLKSNVKSIADLPEMLVYE